MMMWVVKGTHLEDGVTLDGQGRGQEGCQGESHGGRVARGAGTGLVEDGRWLEVG
jgi:hypothetical protein